MSRVRYRWSLIALLSFAAAAGCATNVDVRAVASGSSPVRALAGETPPPKKVVIFYSSIGMGHLSAARSIEKNIKARDSNVEVVLKDIRDFAPKFRDKIEEKAFWYLVKNHPNTFDAVYRSAMEKGNRALSLEKVPQMYNPEKVLDFIKSENADVVLSTHYGSAQVVGDLRDADKLGDIRTGWLHTDYVEGYFPRISNRMDMSFLPHSALEEIWKRAGVNESKFVTTGMPLNPTLFEPVDREAFMKAKGLDPNVKTLVLASGGEGVGDFPAIVKSIASEVKEPFQIVAVCAKNEQHLKNLNALKSSLPKNIHLDVLGFTPSDDLLNFIKVADVYITKSGGLSPTEGFAIMKPMLLLDVYGGHERDNLKFFEKLGMASGIKDQTQTGKDVVKLLADPARQAKMIESQSKFRESLDIGKVTDFVFSGKNTYRMAPDDYGREGGTAIDLSKEMLEKLAHDTPNDMEILLSYAKNQRDLAFDMKENPFGHIAIKVGDDVYTINHLAVPGEDKATLVKISLDEYLFSTQSWDVHSEMQSTTGLAYARDNIGIRVSGLDPKQKQAMLDEVAKVNAAWEKGTLGYNNKTNNCADVTERILNAGGFVAGPEYGPKGKITMPLDVFDRHLTKLSRTAKYEVELVNYARIPDSRSIYRYSKFPVSLGQIRRSLVNMLGLRKSDPLETRATKRIAAYAGDQTVHYENIDHSSEGDAKIEKAKAQEDFDRRLKDVREQEKNLETMRTDAARDGKTSTDLQKKLDDGLAGLTPAQRKLVGTDREKELPAGARKKLADLRASILDIDGVQAKNQAALDKLVQDELDLLVDEAMNTKKWAYVRLKKRFAPKDTAVFDKLSKAIDAEYEKYVGARSLYGQPKDQTRISAYRDFFAKVKEFHAKVDTMYESEKIVEKRGVLKAISESFANVFRKVRQVVALSGDIARVLAVVLLPESFTKIFARTEADVKSLPLTKAIKRFGRNAAATERITVVVKGKETIPKIKNAKTINLFTPTHRQAMNDLMVMAEFIPDDSLIFAVPEYFAPGPLAKALAKTDGFVAVGSSRDPISNAMAQINAGKSQNILIYPEGSVSIGLQETRPTRTKFTTGLIKELRSQGYTVNLIPVVYGNTATPLTQNGVSSEVLTAEIKAPLNDAQVALLADTDDLTLGRHIRGIWLDNLPTDERQLAGKLKVDVMRDETEKFVYGTPEWRKRCQGLFTSP
ncbi:MAG: hypothetical protein JST04_07300 [Bdellovibrionales bacterium]|nr:hypothetical protein [Bdellovibrionales bacterium]